MAGEDALKFGNLAVAINARETAYRKDSNNIEALVYSTASKLVSIARNSQVGNFFKNHLGLKYYPNTLDALLNPESWFDCYANKIDEYYDETHKKWVYWEGDQIPKRLMLKPSIRSSAFTIITPASAVNFPPPLFQSGRA
jgi:hypothetical protein